MPDTGSSEYFLRYPDGSSVIIADDGVSLRLTPTADNGRQTTFKTLSAAISVKNAYFLLGLKVCRITDGALIDELTDIDLATFSISQKI